MAFDPDAFLADAPAPKAFDPDKFLADAPANTAGHGRGDSLLQPDPTPSDVITKDVPRPISELPGAVVKAAPRAVADAAIEGVKSFGRGAKAIYDLETADTGTPLDNVSGPAATLLRAPLNLGKAFADPSKRREIERGVSDVTTFGGAEKLANWVDPAYAATAESDAKAAPGLRDAGAVGAMVLPNPISEAVGVVKKGAQAAIGTENALTRAVEKHVVRQSVEDVAGTNDPLVGSATMTDRKKLAKALKAGQLEKELLKPEVQAVTDLARSAPDEALEKLNTIVDKAHAPVGGDYARIDAATGGFAVDKLHTDILDHIKAISRPANEATEKQFKNLLSAIEDKWQQADGTLTRPTTDLRRLVTDLQQTASDTLGSLKESEQYQIRQELSRVAKASLDKHLDEAAAKGGPEIRAAVARIRESNKQVAALLSMKDALETRIIKVETGSITRNGAMSAGERAGQAAGAGLGYAVGGPVGAGIGGAVGGIAGRVTADPVIRGGQAASRMSARALLADLRSPQLGTSVTGGVRTLTAGGSPSRPEEK